MIRQHRRAIEIALRAGEVTPLELVDAAIVLEASATQADDRTRKLAKDAFAGAEAALGLAPSPETKAKKTRALSQGGKIVSVKRDFGIAVMDLGTLQGVDIGMPFDITRNGKLVGSAMVIDVRDHISGVFVHKYAPGTSQLVVGDLAFLQTQTRP